MSEFATLDAVARGIDLVRDDGSMVAALVNPTTLKKELLSAVNGTRGCINNNIAAAMVKVKRYITENQNAPEVDQLRAEYRRARQRLPRRFIEANGLGMDQPNSVDQLAVGALVLGLGFALGSIAKHFIIN